MTKRKKTVRWQGPARSDLIEIVTSSSAKPTLKPLSDSPKDWLHASMILPFFRMLAKYVRTIAKLGNFPSATL